MNNKPISNSGSGLNIALLSYRSHPFVGGQGIYLSYLSKALVEVGHNVDVISGPPYPDLDPRVNLIKMPSLDLFETNGKHIQALRPKHLKSFSDTFEWWSMATGGFSEPYTFSRRVAKYMKRNGHKYDLVHDNQCLGHGLLKMQKKGLPVVATIHHPITRDRELALDAAPNYKHRLLVRRWYNFLKMQKKVAQNLNHVVTVSEQSRGDISKAFDRPASDIELIYCGIDTEVFKPLSDAEKKPFRLMTTASADQPLKGLRFLLEAAAELKPKYPELELMVVGKLKEEGQTQKLLKKLNLESTVQFVSGISTEQLVRYYNEASLAVSPSLYEGFGLPAGEAMSCGTPVISSDGGALPEVVGQAGYITPAGDSKALAAAIQDLFENSEKREQLGRKGRERIVETFCWKVAGRQFTNYYHDILKRRKGLAASNEEASQATLNEAIS